MIDVDWRVLSRINTPHRLQNRKCASVSARAEYSRYLFSFLLLRITIHKNSEKACKISFLLYVDATLLHPTIKFSFIEKLLLYGEKKDISRHLSSLK